MRNVVRKTLFAVALTVLLAACGAKEETEVSTLNTIAIGDDGKQGSSREGGRADRNEEQTEMKEWQDSHIFLDYCYEGTVIKDDMIYGYYTYGNDVRVAVQDGKTGSLQRETEIAGAAGIQSITVDAQGNIYLLGMQGEEHRFWKIDGEGKCSVLDDFVLEDLENASEAIPRGLFVSEDGFYYLWYKVLLPIREVYENETSERVLSYADRIYVKDGQRQTIYYEQVPDSRGFELLTFSASETGLPVILVETPEGVYFQEIKKQQETEPSRIWMTEGQLENVEGSVFTSESGFLFCRGSGLYEYAFGEQSCRKILDLATYGIASSGILYLGMKDGAVEIIDNYDEEQTSEYILLTEGKSNKEQLSLGVMQASAELEDIVTAYNRNNSDVQVKIVNYYDETYGFEKGLEQLKLDIIRGAAPDILEVSLIDSEMFAEKGALEDLYKYMEEDNACKKDMLMPGILEAYERNGHLYSIAPAFQLYSMWGNNSVIQDRYGVTLQELVQILEGCGKGLDAIYGFSADEPILTTLCTMGMDEFIDWEEGTCDFEGETFGEILEFAKKYAGTSYEGSLSAGIKNGELVMSVGIIASVADYQLQSALYGGNISFIGYPAVGGSGTAVGFRGSQLAMNAGSKNKDAAWRFIKYNILYGYDTGFPVLKEQFEEVMAQAMEKSYDTFEGETWEVAKQSYMDPDAHIEVYEASKSDVEAVRQLVERARNKFEYHTEIMNIIQEEAESYLTGQKELRVVTAVIQNRVRLYLQESKKDF